MSTGCSPFTGLSQHTQNNTPFDARHAHHCIGWSSGAGGLGGRGPNRRAVWPLLQPLLPDT